MNTQTPTSQFLIQDLHTHEHPNPHITVPHTRLAHTWTPKPQHHSSSYKTCTHMNTQTPTSQFLIQDLHTHEHPNPHITVPHTRLAHTWTPKHQRHSSSWSKRLCSDVSLWSSFFSPLVFSSVRVLHTPPSSSVLSPLHRSEWASPSPAFWALSCSAAALGWKTSAYGGITLSMLNPYSSSQESNPSSSRSINMYTCKQRNNLNGRKKGKKKTKTEMELTVSILEKDQNIQKVNFHGTITMHMLCIVPFNQAFFLTFWSRQTCG